MGGLEGDSRVVEARAASDGSDKENAPPGEEEVVQRNDARQIQEQPKHKLKEWYPDEHPFIISTTDSDNPHETPYTCDTVGRPLYRGALQMDVPSTSHHTAVLNHQLSDSCFVPYGYGVTTQAPYIQVIMTADPLVLALTADSDKTFSKPLYTEPQVRERGKPHYGELKMHALAAGHANQHYLDMAVNELHNVGLKAELHHFRSLKQEAERVEQHLHALTQALGGLQGDMAHCKFRLEMVDIHNWWTQCRRVGLEGLGLLSAMVVAAEKGVMSCCSQSQFQAEYIDRYSDDELSDKVKGAVVWKEHEGVEGYFLFHPNTQKYQQVHYLEDLRQWAYIDYSIKKGQWYTLSIAIGNEPSSPSLSVPTTNLPNPTTYFPTYAMSQTQQASASMTLTSSGARGGGPSGAPGSGGGALNPPSGGAPVPPSGASAGAGAGASASGAGGVPAGAAPMAPAPGGNGRLGGNPPPEFTGVRDESKAFLRAFYLYKGMNPTVDQLSIPASDRFVQSYTDTSEQANARKVLQTLTMKGGDIDTYVTTFQNLVTKAGYNPDEATMLELFQDGLPNQLVVNAVRFQHPVNWEQWKAAARLQQAEYLILKDRLGKGKPQ
ncbi:hypothetical protein EDB86DRAFT_3084799 [Lactarius hatsudake]|nr:hypothetical protein EDB86DRAFT_3093135 [Lactarius hatsudake]KAH8984090.1 hypothetical protein EDB86DRAFT_3084799 [Lactarius hatsudake]